jgi:hypothetical protein
VGEPLLVGQALVDAFARLELLLGHVRFLHAVEAEVTRVGGAEVIAAEVPALRPVHELVRLDAALDELVLVLLVVMKFENPIQVDGLVDGPDDVRVVAARRNLQALLGWVVTERLDDLPAGGGKAGLW